MIYLLLYASFLFSLRSLSLAKPIAANALAQPPEDQELSPRAILIVRPTNLTSGPSFEASGHLLKQWPETPFEIPINDEKNNAHINVFATSQQGSSDQTREAVDLINGEINDLIAHPAEAGPSYIDVKAGFTTITLGCHARVASEAENTHWTHDMALDMLKTLKLYVDVEGFMESRFDVLDERSWMANCEMKLNLPDSSCTGPTTKVSTA